MHVQVPLWLQVQGISQGLHMLPAISEMPGLQRLALSDFNSSSLLFPAQALSPAEALLQLSRCRCLTELELLHMSILPEQARAQCFAQCPISPVP